MSMPPESARSEETLSEVSFEVERCEHIAAGVGRVLVRVAGRWRAGEPQTLLVPALLVDDDAGEQHRLDPVPAPGDPRASAGPDAPWWRGAYSAPDDLVNGRPTTFALDAGPVVALPRPAPRGAPPTETSIEALEHAAERARELEHALEAERAARTRAERSSAAAVEESRAATTRLAATVEARQTAEQRADALERELEGARAQPSAQERDAEREAELAEAREARDQARAALAEAAEETEQAQGEARQAREQTEQAQGEARRAREETEQAHTKADQARAAGEQAAERELTTARSEIAGLDAALAETQGALDQLRERSGDGSRSLTQARADADEAREAARAAMAEAGRLAEEVATLRARPESAKHTAQRPSEAGPATPPADAVARREPAPGEPARKPPVAEKPVPRPEPPPDTVFYAGDEFEDTQSLAVVAATPRYRARQRPRHVERHPRGRVRRRGSRWPEVLVALALFAAAIVVIVLVATGALDVHVSS